MAEQAVQSEEGVAALRRVGQMLLRIGRNRRDLVLLEAREEWRQCRGLLLLTGGLVLSATMAVVVATVAIVVACLQAGRADLLAGLVLVYLAGALLAFLALQRRLHRWQPFPVTRAELVKDVAA